MPIRRFVKTLAASTMCLIVVTSCSGGAASPTAADAGDPVRGGEIVYSYNTDAQSVDPATCAVGIGLAPCQAIYGALLYLDVANNEFEPGMAESVTSADGKVWTLKLRPGMTFTDGTPFDAAAVEYNWNRILDPANLSPGAATASRLKWAVIDPLTVEITSAEVNYRLELAFTEELAFIASPTALQQMGRDFGNSPVGAGPFTFTSWARGTEMVLDRNPNYWDQPRPYVDRVVMKTIGADDQRFNALQAGEVDVMTVTLGKYADRARDAGMSVTQADLLGGGGVRLAQRGALADPDVRRAVSTLIDNDQMIAAVFPGEKTAATFAAEGTELYDPEATWPKRDVAQAQKTIDDYRARNGGEPIRLRYVTVAGSPLLAQVSEMLQAQIEEVDGIEFEIAALDGAAFASALNAGDWDLIVSGLGGANGERLYRVFHTNGTANNSGYSNPVVDAALDTTHSSNDPDEVNAAYKTAIRELMNTGAYKFWQPATTRLLSPSNVGGLEVAYQYWFRPDLAWVNQ